MAKCKFQSSDQFSELAKLVASYGWTMEEAMESIQKVSDWLASYVDKYPEIVEELNSLGNPRPVTGAEIVSPNQKTDLEIFAPICQNDEKPIIIDTENSLDSLKELSNYVEKHWNGINAPDKRPILLNNNPKEITFTAENSQFDKDLLMKHFNINAEDEDAWIREALYGEIEI